MITAALQVDEGALPVCIYRNLHNLANRMLALYLTIIQLIYMRVADWKSIQWQGHC